MNEKSESTELTGQKNVEIPNENEAVENETVENQTENGQNRRESERNESERNERSHRKPKYLQDYIYIAKEELPDPLNIDEALSREDAEEWKKAISEELNSHERKETWTVIEEVPHGRKAIQSKWVFKIKKSADGRLDKYKARLVAKGYSQTEGIDYDEVFSPVVRVCTLKTIIALAAELNLEMESMDVVTAYLNSDLKEEIYMELPKTDKHQTSNFCKLNKALYGLKQSGRAWNQKLHNELTKIGLSQSKIDPCLYFRLESEEIFLLTIYVDDLLILTNNKKKLNEFKEIMKTIFEMMDLGAAQQCLGIRISRDREKETIFLDQQAYIKSILKEFNMSTCHPIKTPMLAGAKLSKEMEPQTVDEREEMSHIPYREAVGKLLYLSQWTRPDISYAVSVVSKFNSNPGTAHWTAVKQILRYLKGTMDKKLVYHRSERKEIMGFCDSDWGGDVDDRRSYAGYAFKLGNSLISWSSKKQPTLTLSTTEAEYMALSHATKEALWLQQLFEELKLNEIASKPITICCDNKGALELSKNNVYHGRTKHIDIRHHFLRDAVENKNISLQQISTDEMLADIFTKPLGTDKFVKFCLSFGLENYQNI